MNETNCPNVIDETLSGDYNDCETRAEAVQPADIMAALTEEQCTNLKNNTGLDGTASDNCADIQGGLLCDIRQELESVLANDSMVIFANDFSKCSETDENPTLASMWSRIYRYSQAVACILCAYDPFMSNLLKSGRYPQVLMGAIQDNDEGEYEGCHKTGYPVWVTPDSLPTEDSMKPVTSGGVYQAVRDAVLSVWHVWEDHPSFSYYADDTTELAAITGMEEDDTCLVKTGASSKTNVIYTYDGSDWVEGEIVGADLENFTVTHIEKGYYADKGLYYFLDGSTPTWQVMDANLTDLEQRVGVLEARFASAVLPADNTSYLITTRDTLADAMLVPATTGKTTLVFITS